MTKHKHYDVIVDWANGEKIQCQWSDAAVPHWRDYEYSEVPAFNDNKYIWRIKPRTQVVRYRMAKLLDEGKERVAAVDIDKFNRASIDGFICWVGDITEIEVEV